MRVTPMPLPLRASRLRDLALRPGEKQITIGHSSMKMEKTIVSKNGTLQLQLTKESFKPLRTSFGWGLPLETYFIPLRPGDETTDSEESSEEEEEAEETAMET